MRLNQVEFVRSAAKEADFPRDELGHIVFVGRSNVGKSSTINCLTGQKNFARVSASPGKTVFVNLFTIERRAWLVDLPGYGYSTTSKTERERYSRLIEDYLQLNAEKVLRMYMIVDIRHKPTGDDQTMIGWIRASQVPFTVIANKLDKIKASQIEPSLALIRETLGLTEQDRLLPFSAEKRTGSESVIAEIQSLL